MKKTLLTGIAVLFLATGTAHAIEYDCGDNTTVRIVQDYDKIVHGPTTTTTLIRIESTKKRQPVVHYDIKKEKLTINGKRCKRPDK
jgi:hypothetical protein